jgi:hypothetical protein
VNGGEQLVRRNGYSADDVELNTSQHKFLNGEAKAEHVSIWGGSGTMLHVTRVLHAIGTASPMRLAGDRMWPAGADALSAATLLP